MRIERTPFPGKTRIAGLCGILRRQDKKACAKSSESVEFAADIAYDLAMPILEEPEITTRPHADAQLDPGYLVICWDDPVNLMDYVTHVFQKVFGWPKPKAERHMLEVHQTGKSLLARETLEKAEHYVHQLQAFNLQATMERDQ